MGMSRNEKNFLSLATLVNFSHNVDGSSLAPIMDDLYCTSTHLAYVYHLRKTPSNLLLSNAYYQEMLLVYQWRYITEETLSHL
jgi:hypothetical protein